MMKRPIIMAIALAFSMSLAACGSNAPVLSENNISSQQTSSPAQSTEDLAPEMIAGTLYAVYSEDGVRIPFLRRGATALFLCRTIRENMGKLDVFYSLGGNGDNMNDLGLDLDFKPGIAYNKMKDSRVLG